MSDMPKRPVIDADGWTACLIIPYHSGVDIAVQCGGMSCLQRSVEGIIVPLTNIWPSMMHEALQEPTVDAANAEAPRPKITHEDMGCWGEPPTSAAADYIDSIFHTMLYDGIKVDRVRLTDSTEAWVYLTFNDEQQWPRFNLGVTSGILTWGNCD